MSKSFPLLIGLLIASAIIPCDGQDFATDFQFSLAGELVGRLEPKTIITVSTLGTSKKHPRVFVSGRLEDLPLRLPVADFQGRYTRVFFRSPTLKQNVFTMEMDGNLLDEPRPIRLLLNKPTPSLRTIMDWGDIRYSASVSKRMRYLDLPFWDEKLQKLVPMPSPPTLKYRIGDDPERAIDMQGFCMDFKWFAKIQYNLTPDSDTKISYRVRYESGGAFEEIESEFEYDFRIDRY